MRITSVSLYVFGIILFSLSFWLGLQNGDVLIFDTKTNEKHCIHGLSLMFDLAVTDWRYKLIFLYSFFWLPLGFTVIALALFRVGKYIRKTYNSKNN